MIYFSMVEDADGLKSMSVLYPDDGGTVTIPPNHPNFDKILKLLESGKATTDEVRTLVDSFKDLGTKLAFLSSRVTVDGKGLYFDGDPFRGELAETVIDIYRNEGAESSSLKALVRFLEKVKQNPSGNSVDGLYKWVTNGDLVLAPNGDFVAYKGVNGHGTERVSTRCGNAYSNGVFYERSQIPNPDGAVITMPRSEVDPASENHCSVGLHIGTWSYVCGFGQGDKILVQVNPRDVVSVTEDSNNEKIRACRYVVIGETTQRLKGSYYIGAYYEDDYTGPSPDVEEIPDVLKEGEVTEESVKDEIKVGDSVAISGYNLFWNGTIAKVTAKNADGSVFLALEVERLNGSHRRVNVYNVGDSLGSWDTRWLTKVEEKPVEAPKKVSGPLRDSQGRFVKGGSVKANRDAKGRFVSG